MEVAVLFGFDLDVDSREDRLALSISRDSPLSAAADSAAAADTGAASATGACTCKEHIT